MKKQSWIEFEGKYFDRLMEGASSLGGNIIKKRLHGFEDMQGPMQPHHYQDVHLYQQGSMVQPETESGFPLNVQYMHEQPVCFIDCNDDERGKSLVSDDDLMNCTVASVDEHNEVGQGIGKTWQRIKWTEKMVKLLITAVSYVRQYASPVVGSGRNESSLLQKIGKWKLVSKVMVERGYHVSPQQCEDKFNNLNKSYKRLNDVLGRGTSCKVVENPKLLDGIDISEKAKEDTRKMLSSKQLFYEEMCSFHNGNQLYLPHDPDLQRSLQFALKKGDEYESHSRWSKVNDFDKQVQGAGADDQDNETEDISGMFGVSVKRFNKVNRDIEAAYPLKFVGCNGVLQDHPQQSRTSLNHICPEGSNIVELWNQSMAFRSCRVRVRRLKIKSQMLKLEKQKFMWQKVCWKQDREMNKLRLENESMKIENDRMATELKFKLMNYDYSLIV